jgi:hypothetical protein
LLGPCPDVVLFNCDTHPSGATMGNSHGITPAAVPIVSNGQRTRVSACAPRCAMRAAAATGHGCTEIDAEQHQQLCINHSRLVVGCCCLSPLQGIS